MNKIKFKDLSNWLKVLVIFGWGMLSIYALAFLIGFIRGIMEG